MTIDVRCDSPFLTVPPFAPKKSMITAHSESDLSMPSVYRLPFFIQ